MDRAAFYSSLRRRNSGVFGTSISQGQVDGCEAILDEAERRGTNRNELAYLLATPYHETGGKMLPNVENLTYTSAARIRAVWPSRFPTVDSAKPYVRNPRALGNKVYNGRMGNRLGTDDGYNYRGRGLPHLTGWTNYSKASAAVGVDLVKNADRALELPIAVKVLFDGLQQGWFTGSKVSDHIDEIDEPDAEDQREFVNARRVVNGSDQALKIAAYALAFERALTAAGYPVVPKKAAPIPAPRPVEPQKPAPAPQPAPKSVSKSPVGAMITVALGLLAAAYVFLKGKGLAP